MFEWLMGLVVNGTDLSNMYRHSREGGNPAPEWCGQRPQLNQDLDASLRWHDGKFTL
jgi:hypothetical protein